VRAALLVLLTLPACLTSSIVQTAETAGKDNFQFSFEPGVIGAAGEGGTVALPSINLSARYGVSDRVDIGGRFGSSLLEASVKVMVTEPDADALQVSVAPHLGGFFVAGGGEGGGVFWFRVPVLFDIPVGEHDVVLGPTARILGVGTTEGTVGIFELGTSVGFAARVGNAARIIPEFGVSFPLAGAAAVGGETGSTTLGDGALFSFQIGIVLGGRPKDGG
jgi:hypothetical protein